ISRCELFELRHQEIDQHRLAAARWTNDHRMAQVRRMEIDVIWAARACLEQRDRRPPMIAVLVLCWERMEGGERREVLGRDRCGARPPRAIADQLRPIRSEEQTS